MKCGARNQLAGEVTEIKKGAVMAQVNVHVPADAVMSSVMTIDSLEDLKLEKGSKVKVVVKAVNVLLVKE